MAEVKQDTKNLYAVGPGWIQAAISALAEAGVAVLAPVRTDKNAVDFGPVTSAEEVVLDYVNTRLSLKTLFLPRSEVLLRYKKKGDGDVDMVTEPCTPAKSVVLGCRPCDAAAVDCMDSVFYWDYEDVQYRARRDSMTLVSFACAKFGPACFCTALGGSPQDERGSDVLAFLADDGSALLKALTDKGEAFVKQLESAAKATDAALPTAPEAPETHFDPEQVKEWLDHNFESGLWSDIAFGCLGCGACSYLCPTCHCFDIVDESMWNQGERRRNWDCCAYKLFTEHASGHNPRPNQTARWRQRMMHKFKYFPERFGRIACVGCGRCVAHCGAGQNLPGILERIQEQRAAEAQKD